MVRLFRHPVNAADLPDRHGSAEIPFTVKPGFTSPHQKHCRHHPAFRPAQSAQKQSRISANTRECLFRRGV
jgi:hypothetical protein